MRSASAAATSTARSAASPILPRAAEAQIVRRGAGERSSSNAPIPGAEALPQDGAAGHRLIDLGADEYTLGKPHAIIDPTMRVPHLARALADPTVAVILLDVVL